jgi:hypothetical protein
MGNQESVPNNSFVVKKKNNNINQQQKQTYNQPVYSNQNNNNSQKQNQTIYSNKNNSNNIQKQTQNQHIYSNQSIGNNQNQIVETNIFHKNVVENVDNNKNKLKITPYNINGEISKFKKSLEDERRDFEKNEKIKKEYLLNEIQKFEKEYNPWKILNLKENDCNISNIKSAYKKMALKYHPDRTTNSNDKKEYELKFQLITQSYIYLLEKVENIEELSNKMSKKVEKVDYDTIIDKNVQKNENIYVDKDNFDINKFNKIFNEYKIPNSFDKGYSHLKDENENENEYIDNIDNNNNNKEEIFGKKFNNEIFNEHFNKIKINKKINNEVILYKEPEALESSTNNLNQTFLGVLDIDDFGSVNNNNLSYTDYKKAHIDENLLIDVHNIKYKTYNSIEQLESERSNLNYELSYEDKQKYEYLKKKQLEEDNLRIQNQKYHDELIGKQYSKINKNLIKN